MKCLGILGGMSWESTAHYYQLLNEGVKQHLGGLHSADLLMRSVDFERIARWQSEGDWLAAERYLAHCAQSLAAAGAQGLVIATNTMHKVANGIVEACGLELIHIADCTGEVLVNRGMSKVGLMATSFTMEQAFYRDRLTEKFGIEVIVPDAAARKDVHEIIYQELCLGQINEPSRRVYIDIAEQLQRDGAQGVILGCTEIGMLLTESVTEVPLIDTTLVHAQAAVEWMLRN